MKRGKRIAIWALCAVLLVGIGTVGMQLWTVHQMTSDWTLWPTEVPSKVQFAGRDFNCGPNLAPSTRTLDGLSLRGKTAGGVDIYSVEPGTGQMTVTSILVKSDIATYSCGVMGGPSLLLGSSPAR
ncbi:hypothetical protein CVV68_15015 [Arthrobacter livingstonensis]|uniref:Uncharacterized protein n=2 Tax=Arthrobacter livingstonensis TaxID=670078 RepID=A0A2V5L7N2_9MICC|nr:hypothetical protein CVV68_15015 [Arthrobacter livingstonensis]